MEIENINNQMDKIKNLLVKLHVVGVFAQKRLARGTLFNHPKAITLITT
jgi:urease gamma subunit